MNLKEFDRYIMKFNEFNRYMKACSEFGIESTWENLIKNLRAKDNALWIYRMLKEEQKNNLAH